MRTIIASFVMLALTGTLTLLGAAEPLTVSDGDTVRGLLAKQTGKTVTLRLKGGGEMTGQVRSVGSHTAHLGALAGKEYFDAAVDLNEVSAMIVRVRDR